MPEIEYDYEMTWTSGGKRWHYGAACNCAAGAGHQDCMTDCELAFNADVAILLRLHPVDP